MSPLTPAVTTEWPSGLTRVTSSDIASGPPNRSSSSPVPGSTTRTGPACDPTTSRPSGVKASLDGVGPELDPLRTRDRFGLGTHRPGQHVEDDGASVGPTGDGDERPVGAEGDRTQGEEHVDVREPTLTGQEVPHAEHAPEEVGVAPGGGGYRPSFIGVSSEVQRRALSPARRHHRRDSRSRPMWTAPEVSIPRWSRRRHIKKKTVNVPNSANSGHYARGAIDVPRPPAGRRDRASRRATPWSC